jgi:hypothetical protein
MHIYDNISLNSSQNEKCLKVVGKIETHFMFNNLFLCENHAFFFLDNVAEYGTAGHVIYDDRAHAFCILEN